ncbi:putative alpha-L-arabinofuranosidase B, arabinose-binding domain, beta-L-arabinofuranosidase, GH127 [Lupinus albus]|uniref:Putative alpha-L-arabinofuranosidase B, arabinose-binding domain, beta-L-arabinofuranosidase, GH127 n=1 Tax=Lupinus albus TaxID=3870 RepID=A0A6A4P3T3_LUPAL|nr:putative alpha-L-arabinofuranosidase B, arabinose-binding domain, beta-L-arabinofuranosidase, GH127 [Lupinus albus]
MEAFVLVLVFFVVLCGYGVSKECTNIPTQSHTFRYELLTSNNETWKQEVMSHYHLTPTDDSAWEDMLPRRFSKENHQHEWSMIYRKIKNLGMFTPPQGFLKEVSLQDVRLQEGSIHAQAQKTNLEYLLMLDVDRLIWSFRKNADLPTPSIPYGGWEGPEIELRGHFVGHYLSASALMWASTQSVSLKEKMSAVVTGLSACQEKIGTGYLSAFPSQFFDRFEAIQPVWAPYYTIHKILAGLLDQHTIAGNPHALKMVTWMVDYFYDRVLNVITQFSINRHYKSLNEETGGMNDVLYRLYSLTGDTKHLVLAHLFDKPCFLGLLAVQANDIADFHANTHIPVVVGSQMRYEVTGDPLYKEIGTFFMDLINSSHSYATGGTSVSEFWLDPKRIADNLKTTENEESCTTYNMLKVSRHLFRWTKEVSYADYYERALTNGVLSIQRGTDPGVMIYMLPLGRGVSKARTGHSWGTPFDSFWCCYGTGIESFSKLGDSIYFEEGGNHPALYIIQYISSSFNWKSGKVILNQTVVSAASWDPYLRVTFTFFPTEKTGSSSTLNFRLPSWTHTNGAKGILNGETLSLPAPRNFLSVTRQWHAGDKLTLQLPITLRTEAIKDDRPEYASLQAILYGPYLLAGHTTGDWDIKAGANQAISEWITPIPASYNSQLISFSQDFAESSFVLTNSNPSLTMQKLPGPGTDLAPHATFRLILKEPSTKHSTFSNAVGKSVVLEPFDLPGMNVIHQGADQPLVISSQAESSSIFLVVPGLDGRNETISLESQSNNGCYIYSSMSFGAEVKLSCKYDSDATFNQAVSFFAWKGLRQYNPISFVAKGENRNFLLEPLLNFRDEYYTVYFNM